MIARRADGGERGAGKRAKGEGRRAEDEERRGTLFVLLTSPFFPARRNLLAKTKRAAIGRAFKSKG
jgi:hypothetical protein